MSGDVILHDSGIPSDRFILQGIDVSEKPIFNVSEVGKIFFARSANWMRWVDKSGYLYLDGEYVGGFRHDGTANGYRRYTLSHVERMAHALAAREVIDSVQLIQALRLVQDEAKLWGYI